MFILSVIPITKSIDSEVLSYFSARDVALGQLVTVPLRKKEIKGIVVEKHPVQNLKAQLRGANFQIRNIIDIHKTQIFSPSFLESAKLIKDFYATSTGKVIQHMTPTVLLNNLESLNYTNDTYRGSGFQHKLLQQDFSDRMIYFKTLTREYFLQNKSLHIICPTIQQVQTVFQEVSRGIEDQCFIVTSKTTKKQTLETYNKLSTLTQPSLVISTAQCIDIPQHQKSCVVIEHDSSEYYQIQHRPHIDQRVALLAYAQAKKITCISADSVLRPLRYYAEQQGFAELTEPHTKKIFKKDALVVVPMNKKQGLEKQTDQERIAELLQKNKKKVQDFQTLGKKSLAYIKEGIKNKERIFLYAHKKALAPTIVCNVCGNVASCPETGLPYSLYLKKVSGKTESGKASSAKKERVFVCHQTGERIPAFDTCQFCGSWNMTQLGIGTERILQEIEQKFPKTKVYCIDGNNNTTQKAIKTILEDYEHAKKAIIIVGTKRAIPLLPFIDRSIIVSLDSLFARMSHTISEQILTLVSRISEKTKQQIYLQSRNALEILQPVFETGMYSRFVKASLASNKERFAPPYATLITLEQTVTVGKLKQQSHSMGNLLETYYPTLFTKPGKKKGFVSLFTVLQIDQRLWNMDYQEPKLKNIFESFDRNTTVRINPNRFDA